MRFRFGFGIEITGMLFATMFAVSGYGQDTRTVVEPSFPSACSSLQAQQVIASGEPSSETTFDTSRLQAALNSCPTGQAVELQTSGVNNAFLIQPITIPTGVTLLVDGGVTVFASRNPADYQISGAETCGTVGSSGNGCNPLFNIASNKASSGAGIMGYGVIDGRGEDKVLINGTASTTSWWDIAAQADVNGGDQNNFVMLAASKASNFTLYKITFKNSPMFHVTWKGATGLTVWGMKIITPFTARNSDGIDPQGSNITITHSSISDGDDNVAVSASSASSNITISSDNTYSGHGISVGSFTQGGLSNMLVTDINQAGTAADGNGIALRLKTALDRGGLLQNVTYQNICMQNHRSLIIVTPLYNTNSGTLIPQFKNITFRNIHGLTNGKMSIAGYDANHLTTLNLDNFVFDNLTAANLSPAFTFDTITLGPDPVSPAFLQSLAATGVSYNGSVTSPATPPFACSASNFAFLVGELYLSTSSSTNLSSATITAPGTITLNAMLQPAMSQVSYMTSTGTVAPTAQVQFFEGTTMVGSTPLAGNGTMSTVTLTGVTAGTHTYTALYPGDATYAAYPFGSVTVTVSSTASPSSTILVATPSTVSAGSNALLTATTVGTSSVAPTGTVRFFDGSTMIGSSSVSSPSSGTTVTATLSTILSGLGTHNLSAQYVGDANDSTSTSPSIAVTVTPFAAPSTTTLSVSPSAVQTGSSAVLTTTVTGTSSSAAPTGTVNFFDGNTLIGSAAVSTVASATTATVTLSTVLNGPGAHILSAQYVGDANNATSTSAAATITVTAIPTVATLSLASASIAVGAADVLTVTVTVTSGAGVPTGTVTFFNGTTSLGTGTLSNGTATLTTTTSTVGQATLTVTYNGVGNFGGSTSAPLSLVITNPVTLTLSPFAVTIAPGGSGTVSVIASPAVGFTGAVAFSCSSPVTYITCSLNPPTQTISGTTPVQSTLTLNVAGTVSKLEPATRQRPSRIAAFALALPLGAFTLLGFARRGRKFSLVAALCLGITVIAGITGCGGNSTPTPAPTGPSAPSGTQIVTITAKSATATQTIQVTVNIGS